MTDDLRVTIVLSGENNRWLRRYQSKRIAAEAKSISFSKVINDILEEGKR